MTDRAFVVSLSGIPGSGKTTLLRLLLQAYPKAQRVSYDQFHPGMTDDELQDWVRRGGEPDEMSLDALVRELGRLTEKRDDAVSHPLILFETAFGRAHTASGAFIDFSIWINTPLDLALARATLVFLRNVEKGRQTAYAAPDFIQWQARYMQDYPLLRRMYLAVGQRGAATADLVVDGGQPSEASAALIRKALVERGIA